VRIAVALVLLVAGCGPAPDSPAAAPSSASSSAPSAGLPSCTPPAQQTRPVTDGGLPDITLECLGEGPAVRLSDLRGPLLVNVWAQWCGPCREEAPYLAGLQRRSAGKVRLLGIDYVDPQPQKAIEFAVENGLTYPHLRDPEKQVREALRVTGPPVTAFVDGSGRIVKLHHGPFRSEAQLDRMVTEALGVKL
jgi:cytochrome c biogenesis protein CcmG/thiol:disulfide interchange protein DsbE